MDNLAKCFCFDRGSKRQLLQENKTESEKKSGKKNPPKLLDE